MEPAKMETPKMETPKFNIKTVELMPSPTKHKKYKVTIKYGLDGKKKIKTLNFG
jgi:hypothetical protein